VVLERSPDLIGSRSHKRPPGQVAVSRGWASVAASAGNAAAGRDVRLTMSTRLVRLAVYSCEADHRPRFLDPVRIHAASRCGAEVASPHLAVTAICDKPLRGIVLAALSDRPMPATFLARGADDQIVPLVHMSRCRAGCPPLIPP
jgi:hypothetical protein